jgi:uncharacterized hydantoinase/oxoprolinase family protein
LGAGTEDFYDEEGDSHSVKLVYFPLYKVKDRQAKDSIQVEENEGNSDKNFNFNNSWT